MKELASPLKRYRNRIVNSTIEPERPSLRNRILRRTEPGGAGSQPFAGPRLLLARATNQKLILPPN